MLLAGQASRVICKLVIKVACTEVAVTKANVYVILAGEEKVAKCVCATMFVMFMERGPTDICECSWATMGWGVWVTYKIPQLNAPLVLPAASGCSCLRAVDSMIPPSTGCLLPARC